MEKKEVQQGLKKLLLVFFFFTPCKRGPPPALKGGEGAFKREFVQNGALSFFGNRRKKLAPRKSGG